MNPRTRVLVVDDDREILGMTDLLLRSAGYDVALVDSGEAALLEIGRSAPDLVLLDINMPGLSGWEVLSLLREDERTAELPIVMFSVHYEVREKMRALQQGAQDYLTKPFDTNVLLARVATAITPSLRVNP